MTSKNGYINNPESVGELTRLIQQSLLLEACVGVVPRALKDRTFGCILDIGCGPGSWVINMAPVQPDADIVGIDISQSMITYATARANSQYLNTVGFEVCDALDEQQFPFEEDDYDFIHVSLASSWVPTIEAWRALCGHCCKMLIPGGVLVVTESELALTNSPALQRLQTLILAAFKASGRSVSVGENFGVATHLGGTLRAAGFLNVQVEINAFDFSSYNAMENRAWRDMIPILLHETKPFLLAQQVATEKELEDIAYQTQIELYQENFSGIAPLYTFIAEKEHGEHHGEE